LVPNLQDLNYFNHNFFNIIIQNNITGNCVAEARTHTSSSTSPDSTISSTYSSKFTFFMLEPHSPDIKPLPWVMYQWITDHARRK
jgi:hypothetical protein